MDTYITLNFFSTLRKYNPPDAEKYSVEPGITVQELLDRLDFPVTKVKLVFIDRVKSDMDTILKGGERVSIFPPVGGG